LKCDCTCTETRIRLSAKRTNAFKSAEASVQSTTGSQGVRISSSNARYTMFRGSVKGTGYPLHLPVSPSLPLPCVTVCHLHFNWTLHISLLWGLLALVTIYFLSALCTFHCSNTRAFCLSTLKAGLQPGLLEIDA
jgi:hypothetical protein